MRRVASLLLLACLALGLAATDAGADTRDTVELFSQWGDRSFDSPGAAKAADHVESVFTKLGYSTDRQIFHYPKRVHRGSSLELPARGEQIDLNPLLYNSVTPQTIPPEGYSGPLIWVEGGSLAEMNGRRIEDAIVVMNQVSGKHWKNAAMLGARACILVDFNDNPKGYYEDKKELTPVQFPIFVMQGERFRSLFPDFRQAPAGELASEATVRSRINWERVRGENVYAVIEGTDPQLKEQMLGVQAFYDSSNYLPGESPGADEACSIAALLEVAKYFKENPPARSVVLVASAGQGHAQAGWRDFVWSVKVKSLRLKEIVRKQQRRAQRAKASLEVLRSGVPLRELTGRDAELAGEALDYRVRNAIDAISTRLQRLRLQGNKDKDQEINRLVNRRMLLRDIASTGSFAQLTGKALEIVQGFRPDAIKDQRAAFEDAQTQLEAAKSGRRARAVFARHETPVMVSLHLSSHGHGVGAFDYGFMYDIRPDRNRHPDYNIIARILKDGAEKVQAEQGLDLYQETLRPSRLRPWRTYFLDKPFMGGEVSALAGYLGLTLATTEDARPTWGTPHDTPDRVNFESLRKQTTLVKGLLGHLATVEDNLYWELPRYGLAELIGRANLQRQGELFAEQPAPGTVVQAYQGPAIFYAMADTAGQFRYTGIADKKNTYHKMVLEGYRFDERTGEVVWAIDKPLTGKDSYRVKMYRRQMETDVVMFNADQITLFGLLEPRTFNWMTKLELYDGRRESEPIRYWYSRIDTRDSTMASIYLPTGIPMKMTLSDTVLKRKLILTGAKGEGPRGTGYLPKEWPRIKATEYRVAMDMWSLLDPRIENLETHGIVNQRIRELQQRGKRDLAEATRALEEKRYSAFLENSRTSWALAERVYNDVEATQKDVLFGVLFYVALFVPFAYCAERIVFASADIHRRIIGFLVILAAVIAVIYSVHPAFQLTYSPLVVVLAFFIVGLSAFVSLIIFRRFEQEMEKIQKRSGHITSSEVSRLRAFSAAFVIGVTNLRRRKIRTSLTIVTLVILTFTIMSFTAVKSVRRESAMLFSDTAAYQGIMMKGLGWADLPREADSIVRNKFHDGAVVADRVWLENEDRTTAAFIPVEPGEGRSGDLETARGLVGMSWREPEVTGLDSILVGGSWFGKGDVESALLPADLAERLGIDPAAPQGATVELWGIPYKVSGCFDGDKLDAFTDLDGEPPTPVVYPSETMVQRTEAEMEEIESGEDISAFQSRYQHVRGSQTIIVPSQAALALGGKVKGFAVKPGKDQSVAELAGHLTDRFGLTLFAGRPDGTYTYHAADAINYSGVPNIVIPLIIAVLIVLNTMISSVYERKREIGVYTSIGMAPTHVSYLFIAEAVAFAVISAVLGYLLAQTAAAFLAGTALWSGMTANYSSLAGVAAMLLVITVTLISVIYPSKVAADIAIPDVNRSWTMPEGEGSEVFMTLPFLLKYPEQECIGGFLLDYYMAHQDVTHGLFCADDIGCSFACPALPKDPSLSRKAMEERDGDPCLNLRARIWLAPFDFGVKQTTELIFCPSAEQEGFLEIQIRITRESGEASVWRRINKNFLNDIRKQLLVWRSLEPQAQKSYEDVLHRFMEEHPRGTG
ncbi:FtsX-like permease family protein [Desulfohalovibrio reitneri]|uniref:FtsX-like permease family protein n=1 Tax=Desulfohalovibrio reitneri TaxID=1307759 RepID=UPI00054EEE22|nr:FtsX-like permease family protein [Desulfohalovibrio reitneri]